MGEALSWAQFIAQDGRAQFGHYVTLTAETLTPEKIGPVIMEKLAASLAEGAWRRGYGPVPVDYQLMTTPSALDSYIVEGDPLHQRRSIAAKTWHELQASPLQFIAYCEQAVRYLEDERAAVIRERDTLRTWAGFLRLRWQRVRAWWRPEDED